ncbi:MAG: GIY-YIG nuclease family protein [Planctomycetia bacterium]|nr:GIY-YIG nuclease family protein [Candidatus Brocadia sp.]QOJ07612.1 MAG: GIY-YIG nuclease family protein [Planctomycetia bacterium]TVL96735.1 MAG: hypothetical protein CV082_06025 [Candidatus Brocadia sp. BL1]HQU32435.1 GIY-YIG nuclease family protein [Candidatus Brocadia sapporoensis]
MRDKIYAYLKTRQAGATSSELVEHVLKIKGASPGISDTLIQTAAAGDRRFTVDEHHRWKIAERGGTPFPEAEFVLLSFVMADTAGRSKTILEVSAQKRKNDTIADRLHICIHPGLSVVSSLHLPPDFAQEIKKGVSGEKAACSLVHFFGESVLVGYDVQSAICQINKILNTFHKTIENPLLCLRSLTKRLLPALQQKSLNDIASYFKLPVLDIRRTEKEMDAIADIFSRYKDLLKAQGFSTVEEALEFQHPHIEYVNFSNYDFDKYFLWSIPQKPGVYIMKDKRGEVIYLGKAKNLRTRVSSYFWNTADRLQKITDILRDVHRIEYEVAGSELSAMLMEYRLIQQYRPRLNQQLEVHERPARYGRLRNFIAILPSPTEKSLELFFAREGLPLEQYEVLKDAANLSEVERILDTMYYGEQSDGRSSMHADSRENHQKDRLSARMENGEIDIVLSWLEANKDHVNYINTDTVCTKAACMELIKDYIRDEETPQKKHFRLK